MFSLRQWLYVSGLIRQNSVVCGGNLHLQKGDFLFFICKLSVSPIIMCSSSIKLLFLSQTAINLLREPDSEKETVPEKISHMLG